MFGVPPILLYIFAKIKSTNILSIFLFDIFSSLGLNQFMDDIHQIHDKFFKQITSNIENAKSFVEFSLPKDILEHVDLNTIKPINTEKISKKYKRFNLDIAFRFQTKTSSAQVYYLLEHKSETGKY